MKVVKESVKDEIRQQQIANKRKLLKVFKAAEDLQAAIGRVDDPRSITLEDWDAIRKVRADVTNALGHLAPGSQWKVSVQDASGTDTLLGHVVASSRDDAFEDAIAQWGDEYPPQKIRVSPRMLPR